MANNDSKPNVNAAKSAPRRRVRPIKRLTDLRSDPANANRHTERGSGMMEKSIRDCGFGDSLTVDRNGVVISGNQRLETLADLGMEDALVVQTDGRKPIIHQRVDLDIRDKRAKELAVYQNRIGQVNLDWDSDVLKSLDVNLDKFWNDDELKGLLETGGEEGDGSSGALLEATSVTIAPPKALVEKGDVWKLGKHILICDEVLTGWPLWKEHLDEEGVVFAPYPGPLVPFTLRADKSPKVVMVQPDPYICGHIIDRFKEVCRDGKVRQIQPA